MFLHWKLKQDRSRGFTLAEVLVAILVFSVAIAGLLMGYVQINRMAEFSSMSLAAQSFASQGLEEVRAVQYTYVSTQTNATSDNPFWVQSPQTVTNLYPQVDTLDVPTSGAAILVTNFVSVTWLTNWSVPLMQIRSDCVWTFLYSGTLITNTALSLRAPDQ